MKKFRDSQKDVTKGLFFRTKRRNHRLTEIELKQMED